MSSENHVYDSDDIHRVANCPVCQDWIARCAEEDEAREDEQSALDNSPFGIEPGAAD